MENKEEIKRIDGKYFLIRELETNGEPINVDGEMLQPIKPIDDDDYDCQHCCLYDKSDCEEVCVGGFFVRALPENNGEKIDEKLSNVEETGENLETEKEETTMERKIGEIIKQNKEDMEEKKLNFRPFSLEAAKAGKPVCTMDGRKARIICFDRVTNSTNRYTGHLIVLVTNPNGDEQSFYYTEKGNLAGEDEYDNHKWDLMMLPVKKEGWVNVYYDNDASSHRGCRDIYDTKEQAVESAGSNYITTIKITWEE